MSKTFPTILVPVDFSPYSTEALLYAASLAERFSSSLLVLHVIPKEVETRAAQQRLGSRSMPLLGPYTETPEVPAEVTDTVVVDLRERALTALQAFLPSQLSRHQLEFLVVIGHPAEQILETAAQQKVALIVMGTHGRTGLAHTLLGSVAERIVRLAPCPVLTVKAPGAGAS
jgi:nucleotide-binding universal stress UspA family protein